MRMNGPHFFINFILPLKISACIHYPFHLCSTAQEFLTYEGYFVPDDNGHPAGSTVGRGDVARFMLSLLSSNAWVKRGVAMTTK